MDNTSEEDIGLCLNSKTPRRDQRAISGHLAALRGEERRRKKERRGKRRRKTMVLGCTVDGQSLSSTLAVDLRMRIPTSPK